MYFNSASEGDAKSVDISLGGSNKPDKTAPKMCQIIVKTEYTSSNSSGDNIALIRLCSDVKKSSNKLNTYTQIIIKVYTAFIQFYRYH